MQNLLLKLEKFAATATVNLDSACKMCQIDKMEGHGAGVRGMVYIKKDHSLMVTLLFSPSMMLLGVRSRWTIPFSL